VSFVKIAKNFLELVRFSHTLFALPFALGTMLYAAQGFPAWHVFALILLSMVTARNSAMAFNRFIDARFDAQNPRTAKRHLPAGLITLTQVKVFIVLNGVLFVVSASLLNPLTMYCSIPVWLFLLSYSYWKRFSWLCHAFLGIAIGLSPLGAWIAVRGEFALFPALIGLLLAFWITGFDIIYATQDEDADRSLGLLSIPVRFGKKRSLQIALFVHILMWLTGASMGYLFQMGISWWLALSFTLFALIYIHILRKSDDLDRMNQDFFLANVLISLAIFAGLAFEIGVHHVSWS